MKIVTLILYLYILLVEGSENLCAKCKDKLCSLHECKDSIIPRNYDVKIIQMEVPRSIKDDSVQYSNDSLKLTDDPELSSLFTMKLSDGETPIPEFSINDSLKLAEDAAENSKKAFQGLKEELHQRKSQLVAAQHRLKDLNNQLKVAEHELKISEESAKRANEEVQKVDDKLKKPFKIV